MTTTKPLPAAEPECQLSLRSILSGYAILNLLQGLAPAKSHFSLRGRDNDDR